MATDKTRVYVSVETAKEQLVIDGPLGLLRELLEVLRNEGQVAQPLIAADAARVCPPPALKS